MYLLEGVKGLPEAAQQQVHQPPTVDLHERSQRGQPLPHQPAQQRVPF